MSQSANNWASPDPTKNITLEEADRLGNQLAGDLALQFGTKYVKTTSGETISEQELRNNQFMSPLPVNFFVRLAGSPNPELNIADFHASLKRAALADDTITAFTQVVHQGLPSVDVPDLITRLPAVQHIITAALARF